MKTENAKIIINGLIFSVICLSIIFLFAALDAKAQAAPGGDFSGSEDFCRSCTPEMRAEVAPYLPRYDDGTIMRPIDDSTILNIYRKLWKEANIRTDNCLNAAASMLVKEKVARVSCERKLKLLRRK